MRAIDANFCTCKCNFRVQLYVYAYVCTLFRTCMEREEREREGERARETQREGETERDTRSPGHTPWALKGLVTTEDHELSRTGA